MTARVEIQQALKRRARVIATKSARLPKPPGYHGDLVRQQAGRLAAEIPKRTVHASTGKARTECVAFAVVDGEDENPFPASVSKVVQWIKRFQPKGRKFV